MVARKSIDSLLSEIETISSHLVSSVRRLAELAKHRDGEIRMRSIEAMACLRGAEVDSCITEALVDQEELVRVAALETVAAWGSRSWTAALVRALSDASELVRAAAAVALGDTGGEAEVLELEKRLPVAQEEEKVSILYALNKLGRADYLSAFLGGLSHDFYRVRCATANLSCSLANEEAGAVITTALRAALARETTPAARSSIAHALAEVVRRS